MLRFCTLFDMRYATRALAMLESLEERCSAPKAITILAMDDQVPQLLAKLGRPDWKILHVPDLSDTELNELERTRPRREFCWTCAPALVHHMITASPEADLVIYVDADLLFFDDPVVLLEELGERGNILIHEHRFSPDRIDYEQSSGRFNVGFVAIRVGEEARACIARWRGQVIERCELDPDNGYCGDQGYLNEWPERYPGLRVMRNIGGGVAPWNLNSYCIDGDPAAPRVNGIPMIFFHYHAFRTVAVGRFGHVAAMPAWGYDIPASIRRLLFADYARRLRRLSRSTARHGFEAETDMRQTVMDALRAWRRGTLIPSF